jgi:hypothetical protein
VAGGQRQVGALGRRVGGSAGHRRDDLDVRGPDDLAARDTGAAVQHAVDVPGLARLDDERIACLQLVEVEEGRAAADPVAGDRDVAPLAGHGGAGVVPGAVSTAA